MRKLHQPLGFLDLTQALVLQQQFANKLPQMQVLGLQRAYLFFSALSVG